MLDMTDSIAPRSDQVDAEDLLTGPRTFTIAEVKRGNDEQPIHIHLVEFPGRPWKPSKTSRRILVGGWGVDASTYTGRRVTLYRDPDIKFGGIAVGGIAISHMSDIAKPLKLALTQTRGKRGIYVVEPLPNTPDPATRAQVSELVALLGTIGLTDKAAALEFLTDKTGRPITATKELTADEAARIIDDLKTPADPEPGEHVIVATGEVQKAVEPPFEGTDSALWPAVEVQS